MGKHSKPGPADSKPTREPKRPVTGRVAGHRQAVRDQQAGWETKRKDR